MMMRVSFHMVGVGLLSVLAGCSDPRPGRLFVPGVPMCHRGLVAPQRERVGTPLAVSVEWTSKFSYVPNGSNAVEQVPILGPSIDTNDDGVVDGRDVPVLAVGTSNSLGGPDYRFLRGDSGEELFTFTPDNDRWSRIAALGDVNGDGVIEWVMGGAGPTSIGLVGPGGALLASAPYESEAPPCTGNTAPRFDTSEEAFSLSDMDHDGQSEILIGHSVWSSNLALVGTIPDADRGGPCGHGLLAAADVSGDSVEGARCY